MAIHVHEKSLLKESEMILLSKRDKMVIKATQEHVNLLSLVDIFETSSHFYTITELVTGGPLHDIMTSQPILNPLARSIMMDILSGLAHLHEAGLVYGAVEASNVVCTRGRFPCRVKLVTYGVARSRGEMTARGSVGSAAGDVHAAGLLMFRLLCGLDAGSGVWDRVGEAEGLLRKMLENEAGKRPTARECLTYDWFSASCYSKNGGGIESGAFVRLESDPKTVITDFEVKDRETKERGRKCVKWMIQEDIVDQGRIESVAYEDLDIKKP